MFDHVAAMFVGFARMFIYATEKSASDTTSHAVIKRRGIEGYLLLTRFCQSVLLTSDSECNVATEVKITTRQASQKFSL